MAYLFDTNIVIHYFNGLTEEIAEQTLRLRQKLKTKTPDAIIATTALVNGLTVVTHNTDDFTRLGVKTRAVTMKH